MQQLTLNINNPIIESTLLSLSKRQNKSVETIAIELLKQVIGEIKDEKSIGLSYKILDPEAYMTKINYKIDSELDISTTLPFSEVSDSAEYINSIRKNTWIP